MEPGALLLRGLLGAGVIAAVGAASDRVRPYYGSLLAAIPTTSAVTLLFMGLDHSPAFAAEAALWSLSTQMGNDVFAVAFAALALAAAPRRPAWVPAAASAAFLAVGAYAVLLWGGRAPDAAVQVALFLAVAAWGLAMGRLLLRRPMAHPHDPPALGRGRHLQRAALGGCLVVAALALADAAGPSWGGLFSSFPATFVTLLVVTHRTRSLGDFVEQATAVVPNTVALAGYIVTVHVSYPRVGVLAGTLLSYGVFAALAVPLAAWSLRR